MTIIKRLCNKSNNNLQITVAGIITRNEIQDQEGKINGTVKRKEDEKTRNRKMR